MPFLNYMLTGLIFSGLVFWFQKTFVKDSGMELLFWAVLFLKICCGFAIGYYYTAEYDTHQFQEVAGKMTAQAFNSPKAYLEILFLNKLPATDIVGTSYFKTYSNSFFFCKIISLLNFITGSNYYLNVLFFAFLSLAGSWYFVRILQKTFVNSLPAAVIGFLLFPSILFWTSGILKEGMLVFAICIFWATSLKLVYQNPEKVWLHLAILIFSGWLLWKMKFFVAVLIYGLTGIWFFIHWLKRFPFLRSRTAVISCVLSFSLALVFLLSRLHEQFNIGFLLRRLVWNYKEILALSTGKPNIEFSSFQPEIGSVLMNIPQAVWSILFRPYIWEGGNILYRIAATENILLGLLFLGTAFSFKTNTKFQWPAFCSMLLVFILVLAAMFALSTPNLGSLNRYRVTFLPFLVFLLLQTPFWQQQLSRLISRWQKR
jgi:hypothetical protein